MIESSAANGPVEQPRRLPIATVLEKMPHPLCADTLTRSTIAISDHLTRSPGAYIHAIPLLDFIFLGRPHALGSTDNQRSKGWRVFCRFCTFCRFYTKRYFGLKAIKIAAPSRRLTT
ncbi:hypothetical protein GRI41_07015 [Altererythrobacter aquaemixtae]|uniref:Uncharacterized protein n=1 Tax=Pontixanthobacter aquaemixtae TaxID=1958940 RepID=A0A844ZRT4_9SPHN|nr:hypothetical protein [Pontixanthobacter aquaemixtae]